MDLRVGNGQQVAALAVGTYDLALPSGLILELNNCYYVPAVSRNIISVSSLDLDGFHFIIKNNNFSIYRVDIFYGYAQLSNGLYVLNLEQSKPINNIDAKRFNSNGLNPTYFWHCRLGHVNENAFRNSIRMDFLIHLI